MDQLIGPVSTVIAALLSGIFAVVSWTALREIRRKDKEIENLQDDVESLLKIVVILESLEKYFERERSERLKAEDQLWGKMNKITTSMATASTTISQHQTHCRGMYITQGEHDRLESLRDKVEQQKAITDQRLDARVENIIQNLNHLLQMPGMRK